MGSGTRIVFSAGPSAEHVHSIENCLLHVGAGLPNSLQSKTKLHSRLPAHADLTHCVAFPFGAPQFSAQLALLTCIVPIGGASIAISRDHTQTANATKVKAASNNESPRQ